MQLLWVALLVSMPPPDGLSKDVFERAVSAYTCAKKKGEVLNPILTIIDYSKPSTTRRLWVVDVDKNEVLFRELVAHGKGTGANWAKHFSNVSGSKRTSLGLYRTLGTYRGQHGYSLKLEGLEPGFNDRALSRAIVMHGAWYVSDAFAKKHGRLGRSWGCPALDTRVSKKVIDAIKNGSVLFVYYPDKKWLDKSGYARCK